MTVRKKRNNRPTATGRQRKKRRGNHLFEITEEEPEEVDNDDSKDEGDEEEFDVDAAFTEQRKREEMHQKDVSAAEKILMEKHREEFMRRAFPPPRPLPPGMAPQAVATTIKMCHDQKDIDHVINIVEIRHPELKIMDMEQGYERSCLKRFHLNDPNGNKLMKQYHVSYVTPLAGSPRKVLHRIEKNKQGKFVPGRIVVSSEEVFFAIDDWHRLSLHMGQERIWNYCRGKYYNISQALVKHYCETCVTCPKKNPKPDASRGSRKPTIQSRHY